MWKGLGNIAALLFVAALALVMLVQCAAEHVR